MSVHCALILKDLHLGPKYTRKSKTVKTKNRAQLFPLIWLVSKSVLRILLCQTQIWPEYIKQGSHRQRLKVLMCVCSGRLFSTMFSFSQILMLNEYFSFNCFRLPWSMLCVDSVFKISEHYSFIMLMYYGENYSALSYSVVFCLFHITSIYILQQSLALLSLFWN